jgi:hypothetical protein
MRSKFILGLSTLFKDVLPIEGKLILPICPSPSNNPAK